MSNERFGKDDANNPQGSPKGEDELDNPHPFTSLAWTALGVVRRLRHAKIDRKGVTFAGRDVPKKRES